MRFVCSLICRPYVLRTPTYHSQQSNGGVVRHNGISPANPALQVVSSNCVLATSSTQDIRSILLAQTRVPQLFDGKHI